MQQYQRINWEYTQKEMLEFDEQKLKEAEKKCNGSEPEMFKEISRKEVIRLREDIKERTNLIMNN